jgi:membrane protein YqaA with SNARE-associated domain
LSFLKSLSAKLSKTLALYGIWGLFGIALFDSAGLSMPGVKDLLLIYLCATHPGRAWLYALAVVLGTALGSLFIYFLGRGGARLVGRKPKRENVNRAKRWLQQNDFATVIVASLLPPPLPFKPFLFAAGALRVNVLRFTLALLTGGAIRFSAEAWFGVRYGMGGEEYLKRNILWLSLAAVGIVAGLAFVYSLFRRTPGELAPPSSPGSAPSSGKS